MNEERELSRSGAAATGLVTGREIADTARYGTARGPVRHGLASSEGHSGGAGAGPGAFCTHLTGSAESGARLGS